MTIRPLYQWLLLVAVVLGVYYPALFGGFSPADDAKLLNHLANLERYDFYRLFFRHGGYYYRPFTASTFYLDQWLWGAQVMIMHAENLLLHLVNATLVLVIARRLCRQAAHLPEWLPLLMALLFALHPINTEAVCWISGRYDLLATAFVLGSTLLLLRALAGEPSWWRSLPALFLALFGCLAKETALFFFGGAVLMLLVDHRRRAATPARALRSVLPEFILWCAGAAAYLTLRHLALSGKDAGVNAVIKSTGAPAGLVDWVDQVRILVKVSGFYFKKIFIPYPLNFAIIEISDLYLPVGILFLAVCAWLVWRVWRPELSAAFFLGSILTGAAALLVVFGKMAWTPVAERYLYTTSALFVLGWTAWISVVGRAKFMAAFRVLTICAVLIGGGMTVDRAFLWSDPVALAEDTVAKSPNFVQGRKDLANMYLAMGRVDEGKNMLAGVMAQSGAIGYLAGDISMANQLAREGDLEGAHRILAAAMKNPGKQFVALANKLLDLNYKRLDKTSDEKARLAIRHENVQLLEQLKRRTEDPFTDYQLAKEYLALADPGRARVLFESAYRRAPEHAHYREAARRLSEKLAAGQHD